MQIRPVNPEDLSFIEYGEREIFSDPWSLAALTSFFDQPHAKGFVAEENGCLCGYAIASHLAGEGELLRIAVLPQFRKQGIGKKLLCALKTMWQKEGAEQIFLEVRRSNISAQTLYKNEGFLMIGQRKDFYRFPTEDALIYRLEMRNTK